MTYSKIEILGLRGFSDKQTLNFGQPNNELGSGLTVIVGPNNSGKSTIYEAFRAISQNSPPSFTEGRRNKIAGDKIEICITQSDGTTLILKTETSGGSETKFEQNGLNENDVKFCTLPSRRTFAPFFGKSIWNRDQYISNSPLAAVRGSQLDHFSYRLFTIQQNQVAFNKVLSKVLGQIPNWYIEQADNGQYYLKFNYNGSIHNSDGSGEGLLSIFTIVDTLYDSKPGDLIFIDEPELSLHPSLQKKLNNLLVEYSADRQIIISTHSPYFISWQSLQNGGKISRTVKEENGTKIYELKDNTTKQILSLIQNLNNPHIFGLDAREIFFLDDNIILVEGQEDVIFTDRILLLKNKKLNGTFYGWGVGGASNTDKVAQMLVDLGFKKVAVILDNNMKQLIPDLQKQFRDYKMFSIPADDIREKKATPAKMAVEGLIDISGKVINEKFQGDIDKLFEDINAYLN
ncbi:MAG: AAA family ATPase [Flavobacteriaceae bacterium]|nr:AAA family ATPase [Flavobacteriaceae bacterium]